MLPIISLDGYSVYELTAAINALPFTPTKLGASGLFSWAGVDTLSVMVEQRDGLLQIIPAQPRGTTQNEVRQTVRTSRPFAIPHYPLDDRILADDLIGKREFGLDNPQAVFDNRVNDKLQLLRNSHELTHEYARLGAIRGKVLDADGVTELLDLFTEFGVSETEIEIDVTLPMVPQCHAVSRLLQAAVAPYAVTGIRAYCGTTFFDSICAIEEFRTAMSRAADQRIYDGLRDTGVYYGGITWEEYPGAINGIPFIPATECRFVPVGVPDLFIARSAPADFIEAAGTIGQLVYAKTEPLSLNKGLRLHSQSSYLTLCTRPAALIKGTTPTVPVEESSPSV